MGIKIMISLEIFHIKQIQSKIKLCILVHSVKGHIDICDPIGYFLKTVKTGTLWFAS